MNKIHSLPTPAVDMCTHVYTHMQVVMQGDIPSSQCREITTQKDHSTIVDLDTVGGQGPPQVTHSWTVWFGFGFMDMGCGAQQWPERGCNPPVLSCGEQTAFCFLDADTTWTDSVQSLPLQLW